MNNFKLFKVIDAAGGLVLNSENKILVMKRQGFWDLPKGKSEKFENVEMNAIREVQEETGLKRVEIIKPLTHSSLSFLKENERVVKRISWFLMRTDEFEINPQEEENIEEVAWLSVDEIKRKAPLHENVIEVLKKF